MEAPRRHRRMASTEPPRQPRRHRRADYVARPLRHRAVSTAKFDLCAASRGEEERGELAAHGRCCCLVYARVTFAALMRRVFCTVRCLCELFNCSTLRAPANSSRTRACVATAVLQLGCGFGRALNRNFLHLQVSGAWRFSGSAGRRMQTAMAQDARPPESPTHVL